MQALTICFSLLVSGSPAVSVDMYTNSGAYTQAAPTQHMLDLSYQPSSPMETAYALTDGLRFVAGVQPMGGYYNTSKIPGWSSGRLANGGSYDPVIFKFVDPADGVTPLPMTSFFIHKFEGPNHGFALLDENLSPIYDVLSSAADVGFVSDTPFYAVFVGPRSANHARYGNISWGLPEPAAIVMLALGGLVVTRRRR